MNEITQSIIGQINATNAEFESLGLRSESALVEWVNKGREIGLYLETLRGNDPRWEQLTLGNGEPDQLALNFDKGKAKIFLRIAEKAPEPVTDFAGAMRVAKEVALVQGLLELPQGHGTQTLHNRDATAALITYAGKIQAEYNRNIRDELPTWSLEKREQMRAQLLPIVQIYEALAA